MTTDLILEDIDYNGWSPDGAFRFVDTWVNFADLQSNSPHEANGRILDSDTFATPIRAAGRLHNVLVSHRCHTRSEFARYRCGASPCQTSTMVTMAERRISALSSVVSRCRTMA